MLPAESGKKGESGRGTFHSPKATMVGMSLFVKKKYVRVLSFGILHSTIKIVCILRKY